MMMVLEKRFWAKVDIRGDDECWNWKACKNQYGYGLFTIAGKKVVAHRLSYELEIGSIPDGLHVCHKCDNPSCVNPNHLFIGTRRDNWLDSINKGRQGKLNADDVHEIRRKYGESKEVTKWDFCVECSKEYDVSPHTVWEMLSKMTWKHVEW